MGSQFSELYDKPRKVYYGTSGTVSTNVTIDVNSELNRNGVDGYVINDGTGDLSVYLSDQSGGASGNDPILLKTGEILSLRNIDIAEIYLSSSGSDYRVFVI